MRKITTSSEGHYIAIEMRFHLWVGIIEVSSSSLSTPSGHFETLEGRQGSSNSDKRENHQNSDIFFN